MAHTVVLGAGIGGLTAALSLSRLQGETYSVYEGESAPGGLCRTLAQEGFTFDLVAHVLHFHTPEAEQLVHSLMDGNLQKKERNAWIYFRKRYIPYPFQAHLGFLPIFEGGRCLVGFFRSWLSRKRNGPIQPENFGEWIQHQFGSGIARYFMIPYNTKLWGLPPEAMSVDWVRPFVPRTSAAEVMASLLARRTKNAGYNSHLLYPAKGGIQSLVEGLTARLSGFNLNHRAVEINLDRKTVRFENDREVSYDRLISTIPLKVLAQQAVGMPAGLRAAAQDLRATSLLSIVFGIRHPAGYEFHWVYFPEPQYPFFRLISPSNISSSLAPPKCSILSAEISDPKPGQEDFLKRQTQDAVLRLGLIKRASEIVFTQVTRIEHAYPVHDLKRAFLVPQILEYLKSRNVWSIGRFGAWHYSSLDDTIVEALQTVREATETVPSRVGA